MIDFDALNRNWTDISTEKVRVYSFPNGLYPVSDPLWLHVSVSGGHRILDARGHSHYVPPTWLGLSWTVKDGKPNFVK